MTKTAIITGASGGIGGPVARRLAADGFGVALHYAGNAASAEGTAREIRAAGGRAVTVKADLAEVREVAHLFERTGAEFGSVDVVVHCAGTLRLAPMAQGEVEAFDEVIRTNLRSTFLVFHEAAKHIAEGGRIIAFSSSVVAKATPAYGAYIASKAGVEGLVHVLANEMRGRRVTVNAVSPGPVATEFFIRGKTPEQMGQLAKMAPLERLGQPDDIVGAVSFLAGPDGAWVNAQVLRVNGGFA